MRLGPICLAASTVVFSVACASGTTPHGPTSAAGVVAADDPLLVPPDLTERPGTPGSRATGEVNDRRAGAIR